MKKKTLLMIVGAIILVATALTVVFVKLNAKEKEDNRIFTEQDVRNYQQWDKVSISWQGDGYTEYACQLSYRDSDFFDLKRCSVFYFAIFDTHDNAQMFYEHMKSFIRAPVVEEKKHVEGWSYDHIFYTQIGIKGNIVIYSDNVDWSDQEMKYIRDALDEKSTADDRVLVFRTVEIREIIKDFGNDKK